jgi:RNA polymerase sigma-70 factor (ECF subfamily)
MESQLQLLWEAARGAWPGVAVDDEQYVAFLRERAVDGALESLHANDLYLVCGCLDGNDVALRAFVALLDEVGRKLRRLAGDDETLADAKQRVTHVLLPRGDRAPALADYSGRGELGGWLRIVLARELRQLRRRGGRQPRLDTGTAALLPHADDDPETAYLKAHYEREFKEAFAAALAELADGQRRMLRYAVVERLSIDDIARLEDVHRATAAREVARARAALAEKTREVLRTRLRVEVTQLESILRLVSSQIDVSVRRLLDGRPSR